MIRFPVDHAYFGRTDAVIDAGDVSGAGIIVSGRWRRNKRAELVVCLMLDVKGSGLLPKWNGRVLSGHSLEDQRNHPYSHFASPLSCDPAGNKRSEGRLIRRHGPCTGALCLCEIDNVFKIRPTAQCARYFSGRIPHPQPVPSYTENRKNTGFSACEDSGDGIVDESLEVPDARGVPHFPQGFGLDLPDAFPGNSELFAHVL